MPNISRTIKSYLFGKSDYKFIKKKFLPLRDPSAILHLYETLSYREYLRTTEATAPTGKILVIAPHPDDEIFGCGGTLLLSNSQNIHIVYLTSGHTSNAQDRKLEARSVCESKGWTYTFLELTDGNIELDERASQKLASEINNISPNLIFLPFLLDDNLDHRKSNQLLANALPFLKNKAEIWSYQVYSCLISNVIIDITDAIEEKQTLLRKYVSQFKDRDWANFNLGLNAWNSRLLKSTKTCYAENFFVLPIQEYVELVQEYFSKSSDEYQTK
jgi:LmbE family N-acetylglucosaminyl deacetylase